jgi:hypothetical protein
MHAGQVKGERTMGLVSLTSRALKRKYIDAFVIERKLASELKSVWKKIISVPQLTCLSHGKKAKGENKVSFSSYRCV